MLMGKNLFDGVLDLDKQAMAMDDLTSAKQMHQQRNKLFQKIFGK